MTSYIRHVDRYEWERIIRASRLSGLIAGSGKLGKSGSLTRGGVSGIAFQAIALTFASYGNPDGSRVYPGDAAVAVDCESSIDTVSRVRRALEELGLLVVVKPPRGRAYFQLSAPDDGHPGLDRLGMLSPAAHQLAAKKIRDAARGYKKGGSTGSPNPAPETDEVGGPVDTPSTPEPAEPGGSSGPPGIAKGGSTGSEKGGPLEGLTKPLPEQQLHQPNSDDDLCTDVTVPREAPLSEEPNLSMDDDTAPGEDPAPEPIAPVVELSPSKCDHGLSAGRRKDGGLICAICRRAERTAA